MSGAARRLALVHYTVPPVLGGVEAILGEQARWLRRRGHDVRVIAGRGDGVVLPLADSRHPRVEALAHALAAGREPAAEFDALTDELTEEIRPHLADRDAVIVHNVMTMPFNLPLARALARQSVPVVAWTHDVAWTNPRYRDYQRPGPLLAALHTAQPGVRYVAISRVRQHEVASTLALDPAEVPVVPNGIDATTFWGMSPDTLDLLRRAGVGEGRPLILVPVRVTRRKRLDLALEAAALLRRDHPEAQVVVTGPLGPHDRGNTGYATELLELRRALDLERVVHFLFEAAPPDAPHPVSDHMVAELYRLADAILLPSESEGFGLPVLEAALSRAPIVTADLPVLEEVAGGGGLFTFPLGAGGDAVAAALRRALATDASALRRRVLSRHDWPAVISHLEALLPEPGPDEVRR